MACSLTAACSGRRFAPLLILNIEPTRKKGTDMPGRTGTRGSLAAAFALTLTGAVVLCFTRPASPAASSDEYTARRLACSDWRVRYCLATEEGQGSAADRDVLEKLIRDPDQRVANQASNRYLGAFVRVDREFLREHVSVYYQLPPGDDHWSKAPDIASAEFHRSRLGVDVERAGVAPNIRVLGLVGGASDRRLLGPFAASANPYVAVTAAVAIARLGDETEGGDALERIVERPITSSGDLHHQIDALRLLAELRPKSFETAPPSFARVAKGHDCTTPARWWQLTRIAWSLGYEIN